MPAKSHDTSQTVSATRKTDTSTTEGTPMRTRNAIVGIRNATLPAVLMWAGILAFVFGPGTIINLLTGSPA